jgi:hypothetical protein
MAVAGEEVQRRRFGGRGGGPGGFGMMKPIKAFAPVRTASVLDQLAGRSEGQIIERRFGRRPGFEP